MPLPIGRGILGRRYEFPTAATTRQSDPEKNLFIFYLLAEASFFAFGYSKAGTNECFNSAAGKIQTNRGAKNMDERNRWLQFRLNEGTYAVPTETVSDIVPQNRIEKYINASDFLNKPLSSESVAGKQKWIILIQNQGVQLALVADQVIGEIQLSVSIDQEESSIGFFRIRKLT
jgi:hypothetical protein